MIVNSGEDLAALRLLPQLLKTESAKTHKKKQVAEGK
jgi:hypothetical protein